MPFFTSTLNVIFITDNVMESENVNVFSSCEIWLNLIQLIRQNIGEKFRF